MRLIPVLVVLAACSGKSKTAETKSDPADDAAAVSSDAVVAKAECGPQLVGQDIAPGLRVEKIRAWIDPPLPVGDRCFLIVRIDPSVYQMKVLTESEHNQRLSAPDWAEKFGLVAVANASMFHESGKSTGLLVNGDHVNSDTVNKQFGAFMAFDPVGDELPPVVMHGQGCDGFDLEQVRKDYRVVIQNYRLLQCDGSAVDWKDSKIHSSAAVAVDEDGHVVFVLQRTPYRAKDFAAMLASDRLRLRQAMYVEGGPEASVYARGKDVVINAIGSYETMFTENDDNARAWPIPNVIAAAKR